MWAPCQVKSSVQSSEIHPQPPHEDRALLSCSVQCSYCGLWAQGWPRTSTTLMPGFQDHTTLFHPDNAYSHHSPFRTTSKSPSKDLGGGRQNMLLLDPHLLPCSPTARGGWETLGWSFTPASPACNTELDCFTRNKCYSHPTKEGSWSVTKARAAGGRAAGRPEQLRQGHGWSLSSLWREALLSGVTK